MMFDLVIEIVGKTDVSRSDAEYQIEGNEIHAWIAHLDGKTRLEGEAECLSEVELVRAGRFVRIEDQRRYVRSHRALRQVLAGYTGMNASDLDFSVGEFGKPFVANSEGRQPVYFNLSHSAELAVVAVSRKAMIGADVEHVRRMTDAESVAERYFTEAERRALRGAGDVERVRLFYRCWVQKEAYLKSLGCGLSMEPSEVEVDIRPENGPRIVKGTSGSTGHEAWTVFYFEPAPDYAAAVVTEIAEAKINWRCLTG